jgi:tRNA nucleotidyltransferase (CCA-adding enzyme)
MKYPIELDKIFNTLIDNNIKPVIVGGYVRDYFIKTKSKDIDVELYNVDSLQKVEELLYKFGDINSVGKSFGVSKLKYQNFEIDFSLPRQDNKISQGHKGFIVQTYKNLDFKTASSRRDFTINSIGYDLVDKKILDPYDGIKDIKNSILKAVDLEKFDEDPLRALRALAFCARFNLKIDVALLDKLKSMLHKNMLNELAQERIFEEFEKLLLKSKNPSIGFKLLKDIDGFLYFNEFSISNYDLILKQIDFYSNIKFNNKQTDITIFFALILSNVENKNSLLLKLTNNKKLIKNIENILTTYKYFDIDDISQYKIYKLATKIEIEIFLKFLRAKELGDKDKIISDIEKNAKKLGVLHKQKEAIINGKELIEMGFKPSKIFKTILDRVYDEQLKSNIKNRSQAIQWINKNYSSILIFLFIFVNSSIINIP